MNDFTPFLSWRYSQAANLDRIDILERLGDFVLAGAEDRYQHGSARFHPKAGAFKDGIRSRALTSLQLPMKLPRGFKPQDGDTTALLVKFFLQARDFSRYDSDWACPTFKDDKIATAFRIATGARLVRHWESAAPTVEGAYVRARDNMAVATGRLITLYALHSLLKKDEFEHVTDLPGFSEILHVIVANFYKYQQTAVTCAGLLGGPVLTEMIKLLVTSSMIKTDDSCDFSVIQYLHPDEVHPGSWGRDDEDNFRADVLRHYEAL
jgi:hypothetical protein